MNKSVVSTISAFAFLLLTVGSFYYVWSSSTKNQSTVTSDNSSVISTDVADISGIKDQASKLTIGAENNAGLPIPEPTAKLGTTNPFNVPK